MQKLNLIKKIIYRVQIIIINLLILRSSKWIGNPETARVLLWLSNFPLLPFVFFNQQVIYLFNQIIIFELLFQILLYFLCNSVNNILVWAFSLFLNCFPLLLVIFVAKLVEAAGNVLIVLNQLLENSNCCLHLVLGCLGLTGNHVINSLVQNF